MNRILFWQVLKLPYSWLTNLAILQPLRYILWCRLNLQIFIITIEVCLFFLIFYIRFIYYLFENFERFFYFINIVFRIKSRIA